MVDIPFPWAMPSKHSWTKQQNKGWTDIFKWPFSIIGGYMSHLLLPSMALCGLSLSQFRRTIRYSCFSVLDGVDFHLRIHHLQTEASICPPSWLVCIIACLPVFIADAKSLQMPHHFPFPVPVIFQSFFFGIIIICPERALWKRPVCASARHTAI